ncbi:Neurexophilin [Branchiostoma belcheri]|nr:Neurexophilin [Branchiostoma belcheri]
MLHVVFSAKDERNNTVTNIGDFFRASIYSTTSKSGAVGIITDHLNGTYTAVFRLLWEGEVTIGIQLVHPRQAIDVIENNIRKYPFELVTFRKRYTIGNKAIDTQCSVDPVILKNTSGICNYSDPHAGAWWYCDKAANIPCNTTGYHGIFAYKKQNAGKLFSRSPETLVVIKSANTRMGNELISGDWLAHKLDLMMRETFRGMNVVLVDAWEMTNAQHWYGDNIHPVKEIVLQELEFLCSFICPL